METRAHYALIGCFALAVVFGVFAFIYWLNGPSQTALDRTYQLVVHGSVAGLAKGGAVEFNGVKVGEVKRIEISREDPARVDVFVTVDPSTPIKTDTHARIEGKGFTGVAAVSLFGGTPQAPVLTAMAGEKYPRIETEPSELQNLLESAKQLSAKASTALDKINGLLDENSGAIHSSMKNLQQVSGVLAAHSPQLGAFISDAADVARSLKPVAGRLDRMLAAGEQAIRALDPKKLKSITGDIAGASANLNRFSGSGLREYEQLAIEGRKTLQSVDRAVKSLERDPSQVIFGPSQSTPEVPGR